MSTLADINAYRFQIPLSRPLKLKGTTYQKREGILLERDGQWSEASPLPGFSIETLDDVIAAMRSEEPMPPSLQFALAGLETPLEVPVQIPFNHLLLGSQQDVLLGVETCLNVGSRAVKLKVGQNSLASDIELVRKVSELLPREVALRLDANRAWNMDEALRFADQISGIDFEYIEEPLKDPQQLEELYSQTHIRYALDETLLHETNFDPWPNACAFICKPTFLGGRAAIERLSDFGKPLVFSAVFESGIGVARIAQLAHRYSPEIPAGLDTLDWLSTDLLKTSPTKREGIFSFGKRPEIDVVDLERIAL